MDPEGFEPDPDKPRPRPRVVDKRVSARPEGAAPPPPPPPAAEPEPAPAPEPTPAAEESVHGDTPAAGSVAAASHSEDTATGEQFTPEQAAQAQQIAREIAETPSYEWVVNTAVTLANVAGTKLDLGAVADAQLAIDALGGLIDAAGPRLQQAEAPLRQTLAQLRLAYAERVSSPEK